MPPCVAVKSSGSVCGKETGIDYHGIILCGIHSKWFIQNTRNYGHDFAIMEQRKKDTHNLTRNAVRLERQNAAHDIVRLGIQRENERALRLERQHAEEQAAVEWWENHRALGGADMLNALHQEIVQDALTQRLDGIRNVIDERPHPVGALRRIADDSQNVHTTLVVKQTKNIVERVLKIDVPENYQWSNKKTRTVGEIILECNLGPKTAKLMMEKYAAKDDIYSLGCGIYGRVLDAVWQYIKKSEHKDYLCRILKDELKANLGMCPSGNLTRICNALAGYLDGIGTLESHAEILGREFPKLWDIDEEDERVAEGEKVLDRLGVQDKKVREEWIASLY